jgi:hypothetical protein
MKTKSANQKLRNWVLSGKAITPLQALDKFGIFRLSARILELRNEGWIIDTKMIERNGKKFAQYKLCNLAQAA